MKKTLLIISVLIASLFIGSMATAAELEYGNYDIVFNPTGTHLSDYEYDDFVGDYIGHLKIRLDFYPKEGTKAYEQQYVYMPIEPIPPYPGKVDKDGNPVDLIEYQIWYDSLPREWRLNPALCLFVRVDSLTTVAELQAYIDTNFTPEIIATIDDVIIQEDSAHLITPLLKDKNIIDTAYSVGDKDTVITTINTKFDGFFLSDEAALNPLIVQHQSLDVGSEAINRATSTTLDNYCFVDQNNPVNGDGTIESVEIWLVSAITDGSGRVGMVSMSGNDATTRDHELLGNISAGSKQTFNGLSMDTLTGDYIGISSDLGSSGSIERDSSGAGYWYKSGIGIISLSSTTMTSSSSRTISLYGTGTESGGGNDPPTVTSDSSSSVEETTATLTGTITDTGGENADIRGFQWGTSTGIYSTNVTESGNFSTGQYNLEATGLPEGDKIYWRAEAHNSEGWGYGSELTFHTKPLAPTGLSDTGRTSTSIYLEWTKGTGSENTTIRYRTDQYPTDYNDGTLAYNGTASASNVTGLNPGQIYYFGAWAVSTDDTATYSDTSAQDTGYTLPGNPSNLALSNPTCNTMDAEWTAGTGGDKSMVRWKEGSYPANESDGTQAYFDTSNSTTITSLPDTTLIYVAVFAYDSDSGYYSSGSSQDTENTTATVNPTFTTDNASLVTATTARLNGTISALTCENTSDVFWEWGLAPSTYTANFTDTTNYGNVSVYHDLDSLNASTTYYYRGAARLDGGAWQYGGEISFTTSTNYPPTVTTANATDLYCNSVTGNGNITDVGSANATQRGFQYGIGGFTANVSESGTFTAGVFNLSITGLQDNTEYQYRAFAVNIYGIAYGDSVNFTTTASSDPTFTTSNATLITNTTARLNGTISGLDCEQADDTFWEWGLSTGNYTANYTDTTNRGNGAVYHDLSSLTANTTYYFRGAARLNGGSWQYGSEFYFTTTNTTACDNPSGLTVTALTDSHIRAEWDTADNVTGYLLLVSNTGFPSDPSGSYAVAYNGTETSVTLTGYNLDFTEYHFSLWTYCNPYSDNYVTASIGGDAMSDLTSAFTPFLGVLPILLLVTLFTILAALAAKFIPKLASPLFLLAAPVSMYAGCNLYDNYVTNAGMGIGLALILYSFVCFIFAIATQFRRSEESY